jgi:serine/threonine-protein kinase RsbW
MQIDVMLTLPRDTASVPLARHVVTAAMEAAGVTPDCVAEAEVAISEACTNVVVHASNGNRYDLRINISDEQVNVDVIDSGIGFGSRAVPDEPVAGGRGLALMTAFTDKATFDSITGGGGSVHLVKRLRWSDAAPLHERVVRDHVPTVRGQTDGTPRRPELA